MFTLLKILHLLALAFGAVASLGNVYLMLSAGPHDLAAPGFTNMLRKMFRLTALVALAVFWVSGLLMMLWRYGIWVEGGAFAIKIGAVSLLTLSVLFLNLMAGGWARSGGPPSYVKTLHWGNAVLFLFGVVTAGIAFG